MKKKFKMIKLSRKFKKILKNIKNFLLNIQKFFCTHSQIITYLGLLFVGVFFIIISVTLDISVNMSNIATGLGTGIITLLLVSYIISKTNESIEKQRLLQNRKIVFTDIISTTVNTYADIIHQINEYILKSNSKIKEVYSLYKDFSVYEQFENHLKLINYEKENDETKKLLNNIFDFKIFQLEYLASQLNTISKQQLYLQGLLTFEEYQTIFSKECLKVYFDDIDNIEMYWDNGIKDYNKCIEIIRNTLLICINYINMFEYSKNEIFNIEFIIKQKLDSMDLRSEEEIKEDELRSNEEEQKYLFEHPELQRVLDEKENKTEEDKILEQLEIYLSTKHFGRIKIHGIYNLNFQSSKVIEFFKREDIRRYIKNNRDNKRFIKELFGKDYLKNIK